MSLLGLFSTSQSEDQSSAANQTIGLIAQRLNQIIRGKQETIADFLTAIVAGGSIVLEDLPGVGKTTLAKSFASLVDLQFDRLQCTPDLLPADVFGFSVYNSKDGSFTFRKGPVFCNVLLVDEINRASPRTQSALLEAMAELQVTIEGQCRTLEKPFIVIATQNPAGFQGTYPLPEAQLDRFMFCLKLDYPAPEDEIDLLYDSEQHKSDLQPILSHEDLIAIQAAARNVEVHRDIGDFIVRIANATRQSEQVRIGCSPRGTQMLFRAAQARAYLANRSYVLPDDVIHIAPLVLAHRIVDRMAGGRNDRLHADKRNLIMDIVATVQVPA